MAARPRKSSATITLVLLGAAALAACAQDDETARRDLYASKEDCLKDWGDQLKCEEAPAAQGSSRGGRGSYFYRPMYRGGQFGSHAVSRPAGTVDAARPGSRSVGTTRVTRGGFGGSGHAHSGGG